MNNGTAPAWQVRESQRQKLLEGIQQKLTEKIEYLDRSGKSELHFVFLVLLYRQITWYNAYKAALGHADISRIHGVSMNARKGVAAFFGEMYREIHHFSRSSEETNEILARLFEWAARQIVESQHTQCAGQELELLRRVYGVQRATDEVPFE